ncbi:hypothetical protein DFH28DRAFT_930146 [Melampsora americana]|nr:hypothetical protein DFH28DRAFT_930146 [Melampsora americana]
MASTRRGTLKISMDPSDISSTKDVMIDWLRIHFPKVSIPSGAKIDDVARIVRQQQPHLFPDPTSNNRACNGLNAGPAQGLYPPLPSLEHEPAPIHGLKTKSDFQGKRAASCALMSPTHPKKKLAFASGIPKLPASQVKKEIPSQKKRPKSNNTKQSGLSHDTSEKPSTNELDALRESLTINSEHSNLDNVNHKEDQAQAAVVMSGDATKSEIDALRDSRAVDSMGALEERPPLSSTGDLIDFSVSDCFEVGNLVIGQDIPPIQMSGKKSGVDVFIEGRNQQQKISMLEETVAHLKQKVEASESESCSNMFEAEKRKEEQNHMISTLREAIEKVEGQLNGVDLLREKVIKLETEVTHLNCKLDRAHHEICTHEEIIVKLMSADDSEDESTDGDDDEHKEANTDSSGSGYF